MTEQTVEAQHSCLMMASLFQFILKCSFLFFKRKSKYLLTKIRNKHNFFPKNVWQRETNVWAKYLARTEMKCTRWPHSLRSIFRLCSQWNHYQDERAQALKNGWKTIKHKFTTFFSFKKSDKPYLVWQGAAVNSFAPVTQVFEAYTGHVISSILASLQRKSPGVHQAMRLGLVVPFQLHLLGELSQLRPN